MGHRGVTIVGGGQSGLQLALGLIQNGYDVRVVQNRTAEDIRTGKVLSSQCMFGQALEAERLPGLDFWAEECPAINSIHFAVAPPDAPGVKAIDWNGALDRPARSVDQRVKIPGWMAEFTRRGGLIEIAEASVGDLEAYARDSDLVIVAAGRGEIAGLFERDAGRSVFDRPQRALALTYVKGMAPRPGPSAVVFSLIPGVGEYFVFPALTVGGPCEIMVMEGLPGGPMDCWTDVAVPAQHLERAKRLLDTYLPWEAECARDAELTDDNGILAGRCTPVVREPVARLPSGRAVLGMADAVVLNDPIAGQGANNASKCAGIYLRAILSRGDAAFDDAWMRATFDAYWRAVGRHSTAWTNTILGPPPPHVLKLMGAAGQFPALARRIANGFDRPHDLFPWFFNPAEADTYLTRLADGSSRASDRD